MKDLGTRIAIIGVSASGKSTLVHHLKKHLSLPIYHMDSFIWQNGWKNPKTNDQIISHTLEIVNRSEWILEGYLGYIYGTDERLKNASFVIVLNYSRPRLFYQYLKRHYSMRGKSRPELPASCKERFNLKTIKKSFAFLIEKNIRKNLYSWIASVPEEKLLVFKNPKQLALWLKSNGLA